MVDNPFAFPFSDVRDHEGCGIMEGSTGMTLRDWFAGMAMAGMYAFRGSAPSTSAVDCYNLADAMLAARMEPGA